MHKAVHTRKRDNADTTPQLSELICLHENADLFRIKIPIAEPRKKILLNAVKLKDSSR